MTWAASAGTTIQCNRIAIMPDENPIAFDDIADRLIDGTVYISCERDGDGPLQVDVFADPQRTIFIASFEC